MVRDLGVEDEREDEWGTGRVRGRLIMGRRRRKGEGKMEREQVGREERKDKGE